MKKIVILLLATFFMQSVINNVQAQSGSPGSEDGDFDGDGINEHWVQWPNGTWTLEYTDPQPIDPTGGPYDPYDPTHAGPDEDQSGGPTLNDDEDHDGYPDWMEPGYEAYDIYHQDGDEDHDGTPNWDDPDWSHPNNPESPCDAQSTANGNAVTAYYNTPTYQSAFNDLQNANTPGVDREFAISMGTNNTTGNFDVSPMVTGPTGGQSVTPYTYYNGMVFTGAAHVHHDGLYAPPSAADFILLGQNYIQSQGFFNYFFTLGADGSVYALMVEDPVAFAAFTAQYPNAADPTNGLWTPGTDMANTFQQVLDAFAQICLGCGHNNIGVEAAQTYIIDAYHTGLTLLKQGADGNFHELHSAVTNPPMSTNFEVQPCP